MKPQYAVTLYFNNSAEIGKLRLWLEKEFERKVKVIVESA